MMSLYFKKNFYKFKFKKPVVNNGGEAPFDPNGDRKVKAWFDFGDLSKMEYEIVGDETRVTKVFDKINPTKSLSTTPAMIKTGDKCKTNSNPFSEDPFYATIQTPFTIYIYAKPVLPIPAGQVRTLFGDYSYMLAFTVAHNAINNLDEYLAVVNEMYYLGPQPPLYPDYGVLPTKHIHTITFPSSDFGAKYYIDGMLTGPESNINPNQFFPLEWYLGNNMDYYDFMIREGIDTPEMIQNITDYLNTH